MIFNSVAVRHWLHHFFIFSGLSCALAGCAAVKERSPGTALVHRYVDNQNGIDGLDNVRRLLFDESRKVLYAVSADDDALAAYRVADDGSLTMLDIISGSEAEGMLVGASDMTFTGMNRDIQVVSFYSGAVAQFRLQHDDKLVLLSYLSDRIDAKRVFRQGEPITAAEDQLALLGPYAIAGGTDGISYVAANVSQALVQLSSQGLLRISHTVRAEQVSALGGAVSVALSGSGRKVAVAGMQANQVAIFDGSDTQSLVLQQTLPLAHQVALTAPMFVAFVPQSEELLVAQKHGVLVYSPDPQGHYKHSVELRGPEGLSLAAISRLDFDPTGQCMLALSESSSQVYTFSRVRGDQWQFLSQLDVQNRQAPTSVAFISSGKVALSFARSDAIYIYANICG
ncbi:MULTISPECIES: hypothetical protein [unclassified Pseudoalteromonas]|uniref:hypothetical protein n=1 Tax=unclassified Pseudoalteromonas TaxID=194690 RepID=UPI002097D033|nr:hypothetical protein [Pseudoalteromonas sp. XMcav2-N]MCO7190143.1 hypothetical protein [Pseudoalteromonas sp. XMcav2-N]